MTLAARRALADVLLGAAVLVGPVVVVSGFAADPAPARRWTVAAVVLGSALTASLLRRLRDRPMRWRSAATWAAVAGAGGALGLGQAATTALAAVTGGEPTDQLAILTVLGLPGLALALTVVAAAVVGAAPPADLAASTVTFVLWLRGVPWLLWFGRDSLALWRPVRRRRRYADFQPSAVVAMHWCDIAAVQPGRVETPLARCPVATDVDLPYTMGEALLIRGAGGQQWVLPVESARTAADLVERARRARRRTGSADDREVAQLRIDALRGGWGVLGLLLLSFGFGVWTLWQVVTGQFGPAALLGVLFWWSPLLLLGGLFWFVGRGRAGRPDESAPPPFAPSWQPVPGWVALSTPARAPGRDR